MEIQLRAFLIAAVAILAFCPLRGAIDAETELLREVAHFFGRSSPFKERGEINDFLNEQFVIGTDESKLKKNAFALLEEVEPGANKSVLARLRHHTLQLEFVCVALNGGGPIAWTLTIYFVFDSKHRLERSFHSLSFTRWDGPIDDDPEAPNQPSQPTPLKRRG